MSGRLTRLGEARAGAMTRRRLVVAALVGVIVPATASAAVLSEPDKRAIRQVIEAQLMAFAADDAGSAYA